MNKDLIVIGGGLAGCEAAWQAAKLGVSVTLYEMRPQRPTPAHVTDHLAELVCSNSLGSILPNKAPGLLKAELRGLGSMVLACATQAAVPAGSSLAVDREQFSQLVSQQIESQPNIRLVRQEMGHIPAGPCIIASGPLTSDSLAADLARLSGRDQLYFYDAISPIVSHDSLNMDVAFRASRYDKGEQEDGDYINCPLNESQYQTFYEALVTAGRIELRDFEREEAHFFEGCLPVEVLAGRDRDALRYGPLRPVGIHNPHSPERPYAVVQLRQDNLNGTLYNLVGFQTNLRIGEQRRVLQLIPGLEKAEFLRYGMMHRNTYLNAPELLQPTLQYRGRADLFFAGQITGVEGYVGNIGTGLLAGINAARLLSGSHPLILPPTTMLGALCHYVTHAAAKQFQPMKANFGLLPPPEPGLKQDRPAYYNQRSLTALRRFARERQLAFDQTAAESF